MSAPGGAVRELRRVLPELFPYERRGLLLFAWAAVHGHPILASGRSLGPYASTGLLALELIAFAAEPDLWAPTAKGWMAIDAIAGEARGVLAELHARRAP